MTENKESRIISITPNPANEWITVNALHVGQGNIDISIYSVDGSELYRRISAVTNGNISQKLHIANLPNGIYIVKLTADHAIYTGQFVKD